MWFKRPTQGLTRVPRLESFNPALRVVAHIGTRRGDAQRGPEIRLAPADARLRLLSDGELVWIQGERGQQLAPLVIDPSIEPHTCVLRDIPGVVPSEEVRVTKPDLDTPTRT